MKDSGVRVEGARFQVSDQVLGFGVYALENWSVEAEPPVSFTASPANVAAEGARFREEVSGVRVSPPSPASFTASPANVAAKGGSFRGQDSGLASRLLYR